MDDNKYLNPFDDPEFTKEVKLELQTTFDRCIDRYISKHSSETELGKPIFINHIHECVFKMFYKKKIAKKKCKAYLTSIGEKMDEYEEICDKCPYMRIICLDKDDNIVFIE